MRTRELMNTKETLPEPFGFKDNGRNLAVQIGIGLDIRTAGAEAEAACQNADLHRLHVGRSRQASALRPCADRHFPRVDTPIRSAPVNDPG